MNFKTLILISLLSGFTVKGQVKDFIRQFKIKNLPYCADYSREERVYFGSEFDVDSTLVQTVDSTYWEYEDVYEKTDYQKPDSLLISTEFVKQYLLPAKIKSNDSIGKFYSLDLVVERGKYYGVTYERIFENSMDSSEKYFCTFSKKGKFISRVVLASYIYSGTGTSISGARFPWFPEKDGCIEKDLIINIPEFQGEKREKYRINRKGEIVEIE